MDEPGSQFGLLCQGIYEKGAKCRSLNEEITGSEKKQVMKEFEQRILNPIKEIVYSKK